MAGLNDSDCVCRLDDLNNLGGLICSDGTEGSHALDSVDGMDGLHAWNGLTCLG